MAIKKSELYSSLWSSCHLIDYWAATMRDVVWIIASVGWEAAKAVRQLFPKKDKNGKAVYREAHDFVFDKKRYKADLIPPALMVARYFAAEQAAIEQRAAAAAPELQMEERHEEHGGEDGLLFEVIEDGKYAKLTEAETKTLVVDDKWLAALAINVQGKLDRVSQTLTGCIKQLSERYAMPLLQLEAEVAALHDSVAAHLRNMGFTA